MKFKMATAAAASAALALSPVAAQAASPTYLVAAQAVQTGNDNESGGNIEVQIGVIFFLIVFAVAIFASGDGDQAPVSP